MPSTTPLNFSTTVSTTALSPANASSTNLQLLKTKELEATDNKVLLIMYNSLSTAPSLIDSTIFASPKSLAWNNNINYNHNTQPIGSYQFSSFGLKIFAYLDITKDNLYTFSYSGSNALAKFYLNNYLVLDNVSGSNDSIKIYLKSGLYMFYAEILHRPITTSNAMLQYSTSSFYLLPDGVTTKDSSSFLDKYLSNTPFTLLKNISNIRTSSYQTYCKDETNLITASNICDTSLTSEDILNNQVMDICFSSDNLPYVDSLDNTKLKQNCKNIYNKTNLNTNIKKNLNSKYDSWAKSKLTDINNDNYVLDYLNFRNPTLTDLPLDNPFYTYCENQNSGYYIPTISKSKVCDSIYNNNKIVLDTNSADLINKSKQRIKTNYCSIVDINGNLNNITTDNCKTELKGNSSLSTPITTMCFPNDKLNKGSDGKMNTTCKNNIRNLTGLNTTIATDFDTKYNNWAANAIKSSTYNGNDDIGLNEYIIDKSPDAIKLFGSSGATSNLVNYCEDIIGDTYSADLSKANTSLCNNLYTNSKYNTDTNIKGSINNIKKNYCLKTINGKPRYETDSLCKNIETDLLKDTIISRCSPSTGYSIDDSYCNNLSDNNIINSNEPYKTINASRTNLLKSNINSLSVENTQYTNSKMLNDNLYNYAIGKYNEYNSKKLSDELLNQKLFDFCENKDQNFTTNSAGQCYGIYNKFKTNTDIINSRNRMRDGLCKLPENIATNINDDYKTNAYNCADLTFNTTTADLLKFAPAINNYCSQNNNITSQTCIDYYNNIENRVLNQLNIKSQSAFQNKDLKSYKNIELESFNNDSESNQIVPVIDNPVQNNTVQDNSIQDNSTDLLVNDLILNENNENEINNENNEYTNSDNIILILLWFIFIVLLITALGICINKNKDKSSKKNIDNQIK